jgi:chorismate--pyruvate lyase
LLLSSISSINHSVLSWYSMLSRTDYRVPKFWRDWLFDSGSLTERLLNASDGQLSVNVIKQQFQVPSLSERQVLGLPNRQLAMIREVLLCGAGRPWVFARSVLPLTTVSGRLRKLKQLDNQPLGALLFKDPTMTREPVEIACVHTDNNQLPRGSKRDESFIWGRRSVFRLDKKPLLVAEFFLPSFNTNNP